MENTALSYELLTNLLYPKPSQSTNSTEEDAKGDSDGEIVYLPLENFVTFVVKEDSDEHIPIGYVLTESNHLSQFQGCSKIECD